MSTLDDSKIQAAAAKVLVALRRAEGLDDAHARALIEALGEAAVAWRGSAVVPRTAANLFADLASGIEACSFAYQGDEGARIAAFAMDVQEAVREVLRVP